MTTAAQVPPPTTDLPPLPDWDRGEVVVPAPGEGAGWWAGAPTAIRTDGVWYLAYRLRRPVGSGRGYANVIARSFDGVRFETCAVLDRDAFGAESLERPALVRTPDGAFRVYVSCATPGTKHWRVDVVEAATAEGLATARPRTVLPGDERTAVKDPVLLHDGDRWHLWASCHPLDDPAATDRMRTDYATSDDGIDWRWRGTVLSGRAGRWDARGVRMSAVLLGGPAPTAFYDGRASAAQNWEERTGLATGSYEGGVFGTFAAVGEDPAVASPHPPYGLRYVSAVRLADGIRLYYEATRADGAHELRTELIPS